jgi:hypothetical protein
MTGDLSSELNMSEATGIAAELQRAFKLNYPNSFKDVLRQNYDRLTFEEQFGHGSKEDEKKKAAEGAVAMAKMSYDSQISHVSQFGFKNNNEFFGFSKNFEDEEFMRKLDALPQGEKTEIANKMAEKFNNLSPEGQKKYAKEHAPAFGFLKENNTIGLNSSKEIEGLKEPIRALGGDEAVRMAQDLQDKIAKRDELVDKNAYTSINEEEMFAKNEARLAAKNLRDKVYESASDAGLENLRDNKLARMEGVSDEVAKEVAKTGKNLKEQGGEVKENDSVELQQIANNQKDGGMDLNLIG